MFKGVSILSKDFKGQNITVIDDITIVTNRQKKKEMDNKLAYKWYLESTDQERSIFQTSVFDKEEVRTIIIKHLSDFPKDTLLWYKVNKNDKYVGDDFIAAYSVNPNNNIPSKEVFIGKRLCYKSLYNPL